MNQLSPQLMYKRTQAASVPDYSDAHELVLVTLRELHRSLSVLVEKPAFGSEPYQTHTARALTALYILQRSLDFDRGGDIASNLFRLYEFCRMHLLALSRRDGKAEIEAAHRVIGEILDAWKRIG